MSRAGRTTYGDATGPAQASAGRASTIAIANAAAQTAETRIRTSDQNQPRPLQRLPQLVQRGLAGGFRLGDPPHVQFARPFERLLEIAEQRQRRVEQLG